MVPFYIPRSHGTELSIKLITRQKAPPPASWVIVEEKSLSLNEEAARKLSRALKEHFAVAEQPSDGNYIVIPVSDGVADVADLDPAVVAKAVVGILNKKDIVRHLASSEIDIELVSALRGAIRLQEMRSAVTQLRQNLDSGIADEQLYQSWCEKHCWAFGNAYVVRDDVRQITPGDKLDLLLPTVVAGYRDLVELKRPDKDVLLYDASHKNYYFSSEVSKAIGQCHRYLDMLHSVAANGLLDHQEIVAYHPRAIIVIGRSADWSEEKLKMLHGLNSRLTQITVMTYDQLLAQGQRLVDTLDVQNRHDSEDDLADLQVLSEDIFGVTEE
jgi:hypothetical protein